MDDERGQPAPAAPAARTRPDDPAGGVVIGRPFGVPVHVTPTWFVVAGLITWIFAPQVEDAVPDIGPWRYAVSLGYAVLLYASVLLHELAHTVVALRSGLPVRRISLYFLGGVSEIEKPSTAPRQEAWIAAAGPLLSVLLGIAAYGVEQALEEGSVGRLLASALVYSNLLVGAFNMLPGLPLDGGRVVSAAVWGATGRRHAGTVVAAWAGRAVAVLVLVLPAAIAILRGRQPLLIDLVWGGLLASFIWVGATQALQSAKVQQRIPALSARALSRRAAPVAADVPLAEALRQAIEAGARSLVVVAGDGSPVALVNDAAVAATPPDRRPWVPVSDVARRLQPEQVLSVDLTGEALVEAITRLPSSQYLVLDTSGLVFGVLATADVEQALSNV